MATNEGCSKLIERGRSLPASHTEAFTNQNEDQTTVGLFLYQGEDNATERNAALGVFTIPIRTAATKGAANVQVTVKVSREKSLTIVVQDINTGATRTLDGGYVE
jgi:molecular chaperone DnaK